MTSSAPSTRELLDLSGRVALVTGAGSGIGTGIATRLAEAGAAVAVHYHRSADGAAEVVGRITAAGGSASAFAADVTDPEDVAALFNAVARELGAVDVLINNAGIYPLHSIVDMSLDDWQAVVAGNLTSVHLATQAFARQTREVLADRGAAIVNIASIEASNVAPAHSHYAAAKAAVLMYTKSAARELGPRGIRVNAVSPGLIWRQGLDEAWPEGVQAYTSATPLGRLGRFDDVADACLFLASRAARWITGTELVVDGGVLTNRAY
ncbi:MAG TPA: glucose 1-dehydrogenase [Luteitalea sp.]|nr:glucose 1-dehydrogenase [Luteitalea sp.]